MRVCESERERETGTEGGRVRKRGREREREFASECAGVQPERALRHAAARDEWREGGACDGAARRRVRANHAVAPAQDEAGLPAGLRPQVNDLETDRRIRMPVRLVVPRLAPPENGEQVPCGPRWPSEAAVGEPGKSWTQRSSQPASSCTGVIGLRLGELDRVRAQRALLRGVHILQILPNLKAVYEGGLRKVGEYWGRLSVQ